MLPSALRFQTDDFLKGGGKGASQVPESREWQSQRFNKPWKFQQKQTGSNEEIH